MSVEDGILTSMVIMTLRVEMTRIEKINIFLAQIRSLDVRYPDPVNPNQNSPNTIATVKYKPPV